MAESARLLNGYTPKGYRGFESHPLRHFFERLGGPEALRRRWLKQVQGGGENLFGEPSGEQAMPIGIGREPGAKRSQSHPLRHFFTARSELRTEPDISSFFRPLGSQVSFRSWDST